MHDLKCEGCALRSSDSNGSLKKLVQCLTYFCDVSPCIRAAGLLALGHMHGVNTGRSGQPDDLAIARELMRTCYEMYARTPTGLAPEIVHFVQRDGGSEFPKQHEHDVGGGDFTVTPQV